jgi:hypothetical protein
LRRRYAEDAAAARSARTVIESGDFRFDGEVGVSGDLCKSVILGAQRAKRAGLAGK